MRPKTLSASLVVAGIAAALIGWWAVPAAAAEADRVLAAASLETVIDRITTWLVGLLVALATLLLTIGGVRYLLAGGDPGEVHKARETLKYAAVGYGVAALAPVLVGILEGFVA